MVILRKYAPSAIGAPGNEYGNWVGNRIRHRVGDRVREYDNDLGLGMNGRALAHSLWVSRLGLSSIFISSSFDR